MAGELVKAKDYNVITRAKEIRDVVQSNLGGRAITAQDLDIVKMPTGGSTKFIIPCLEGEKSEDQIVGIIVFWKERRTYWSKPLDEVGQQQPDCYSHDALKGIGEPGGDCAICQFSKFGTALKGKGQACTLKRQVFISQEESLLPLVMEVSPASINVIHKYFLRLASNGISHWGVETRLSLEKVTSKDGIGYARLVASMSRRLDDDAKKKIKEYVDEIRPALETSKIRDEDKE